MDYHFTYSFCNPIYKNQRYFFVSKAYSWIKNFSEVPFLKIYENRNSYSKGRVSTISNIASQSDEKYDCEEKTEGIEVIEEAIHVLEPFITQARIQKINNVLDHRTTHSCFVFENPSNPSNVWACLRSLDTFGVQNANLIVDPAEYDREHRLANMKVAMGSSKWLTLREFQTSQMCVEALRAQGYRILASDLAPNTKSIEDFDWSIKTALVIGNEDRGISETMRTLCDGTFQIPMKGFAGSLNMSVASAVMLAHLSMKGGLPKNLTRDERTRLYLLWLIRSHTSAEAIIRQRGISLPPDLIKSKRILGFRQTTKPTR